MPPNLSRCPICMDGDRRLKASHGVIAMGNMVDTLLKLRKSGLETDDTASMLIGVVSTPGGNAFWVEMDAEGIEALERTVGKRKSYSFDDAHVSVGDVLVYTRDESITATIVADKKIQFEEEVTSLSKAALTLLHRDGYKWKQANGWAYWMKDGETMGERVERFAPVEEDD